MKHFELVAVGICSAGGAERSGHIKTAANISNAIVNLVGDDMAPLLLGAKASRIEQIWRTLW